ncbi:TldD/PmbA family protein [Desertifilum sp. FACHB-1129]|uniref:TldD/PmbA family protein n=1 Tax=unclassified Desertifilum TaxID=2621682 RepID=UPI001684F8DB|nr:MULTISPECIES: TldD/PmbA family protein [unclassified Desertifilum]MBD2314018.1 TldD/PmbA family protein [Desertifilum sp. FACHB-1129]MBD2320344.1 TldD/PmbA family protein [Desertifilum sp. FACHB-866]MBD2330472.1 TldD/PmbA family protein [Desertifilum sp. FACHB-868]MDA0211915.1 TldD/PmbA family protein [Cyanobacteria bacterium FC1]
MSTDQLAEQLLELALKSGAEAAEVFESRSLSRTVFFEANRLKQQMSTQTEGTALRLWCSGRPGLAVAYGPVDAIALVEKAIALSHLNQPDLLGLAEPQCQDFYPDLGQSVPVEQLVNWGEQAIDWVRVAYPEVLCMGEWDCEAESIRLLNSKGLDCGYTDTTLSCYLTAEWVRGDDFLSVSDGQTLRGDLDVNGIIQQLLQRLEWASVNATPAVGRVPVLFTAKAADMLWGTVMAALNGKQVLEQASPWSKALGSQVVADRITLFQQPEAGPYSCPFDDEGIPTQPRVFIQNGVLESFYTDRTTGYLLGMGTTGNGFRPGLESYPTPSLFNLLVQPGTRSLEQLIAQLDNGVVVDQMLGSGAGISGDFSINVDLGYRIRNGEIVGRVKDTMVAGNVYQALKHGVELGSDAEWNGSCYTPSAIVEGLSVTGRNDN